jgi:hypothetical protein
VTKEERKEVEKKKGKSRKQTIVYGNRCVMRRKEETDTQARRGMMALIQPERGDHHRLGR